MTNSAPSKHTMLTLYYLKLKHQVEHERQYFRYRPDLIERMNAVHNQIVNLQTDNEEVRV